MSGRKIRENNFKKIVPASQIKIDFPGILRTLMIVNGHATATIYYNLEQSIKAVVDTDDMPLYSYISRYFDAEELKGRKIQFINVYSDTATTPLFLEFTTVAQYKKYKESGNINLGEESPTEGNRKSYSKRVKPRPLL